MTSKQTFKTFQFTGLVNVYKDYTPKHVIAADTDSVYLDVDCLFGNTKDKEEVIQFGQEIEDKINKDFKTFIGEIFNIPKHKKHIIHTEREAISDKSLFLAKKMYVMHLVDFEGKPCDKLKMMGVAIKKTDTPVVVQGMLKELVEMLMDRMPYESIESFVRNFKDRYETLPMFDIGKPIAVKSLTKYQNMYVESNSMKGYPYHIRSAMFYNELCGTRDRKITSADKVRIVYINHQKYKYIALPVDAEVLPDFVDDLCVNWKKQWETVMKKVNIFLKPIGYDLKGRQKEITMSQLSYGGFKL